MENWKNQLEYTLSCAEKIGGEVKEFVFELPASTQQLSNIEKFANISIPSDYKKLLTEFSSQVRFEWRLNDKNELPEGLDGIFCGVIGWNINEIVRIYDNYKSWIKECFPNPDDPYDRVWHHKFPVLEVDTGDILALDLSKEHYGNIVFLSHDGCNSNGYILGRNLFDFLDRWIQLGYPGPEDWQWMPFTHDNISGIDPDCENAKKWKSFLYGTN